MTLQTVLAAVLLSAPGLLQSPASRSRSDRISACANSRARGNWKSSGDHSWSPARTREDDDGLAGGYKRAGKGGYMSGECRRNANRTR